MKIDNQMQFQVDSYGSLMIANAQMPVVGRRHLTHHARAAEMLRVGPHDDDGH